LSDNILLKSSGSGASGSNVTWSDDGTNWVLAVDGTTICKFNKSTRQLLLEEGSTDDAY